MAAQAPPLCQVSVTTQHIGTYQTSHPAARWLLGPTNTARCFWLIGAEKGTRNERFPMAVSEFILQLTAFVMHTLTLSHFTVGVLE